jgi:hypothetical protein
MFWAFNSPPSSGVKGSARKLASMLATTPGAAAADFSVDDHEENAVENG